MKDNVKNLQKYLSLVRNCAGWTTTDLGKKLDVSRQMISSIENGRPLTQIQYSALRYVFDQEIKNNPDDTKMLSDVLKVLVDDPENYTDEERNEIFKYARLLSPAIVSKKSTRSSASKVWAATLTAGLVAGIGFAIKLLNDKKN